MLYWILLGASVGLGLLTKYTMAFFHISAFLFMLFNADARKHLSSKRPYIAFAISMLCFAPVIVWNAANGWVTFRHTAGQAHVADGLTLAPKYFIEFIGSQFGIVTPVLFVLIIIALWRMRKDRNGAFLFWFSMPVILFFVMKSVQGKVQANWALTGYAGGFIAFSACYMRNIESAGKRMKVLVFSGLLLALAVTAVAHFPAVLKLSQKMDPSSKLAGWRELGQEVTGIYNDMSHSGPLFIFSDAYQISSELAFYVKGKPVTYCVNLGRRMNQYDLWPGFERLTGYNAIFVTYEAQEIPGVLAAAFAGYEKETLELTTKKNKTMKFTVFKCYDFRGIESKPAETY
jgi:undecaprenyl-diphosphatase